MNNGKAKILESANIFILGSDRNNQPLAAEEQVADLPQSSVELGFLLRIVASQVFQVEVGMNAMDIFIILTSTAQMGKGPG